MSKSLRNYYRLADVEKKGFSPMDLRYLYLLTHYRKTLNFTWEGLEAARTARIKLIGQLAEYVKARNNPSKRTMLSQEKQEQVNTFQRDFLKALSEDLNVTQAVAVLWSALKSNIPSEDKYDLIVSFDDVLGLDVIKLSNDQMINRSKIPDEIQKLVDTRSALRAEKKWDEADVLREQIEKDGYMVEDMPNGKFTLHTLEKRKT